MRSSVWHWLPRDLNILVHLLDNCSPKAMYIVLSRLLENYRSNFITLSGCDDRLVGAWSLSVACHMLTYLNCSKYSHCLAVLFSTTTSLLKFWSAGFSCPILLRVPCAMESGVEFVLSTGSFAVLSVQRRPSRSVVYKQKVWLGRAANCVCASMH